MLAGNGFAGITIIRRTGLLAIGVNMVILMLHLIESIGMDHFFVAQGDGILAELFHLGHRIDGGAVHLQVILEMLSVEAFHLAVVFRPVKGNRVVRFAFGLRHALFLAGSVTVRHRGIGGGDGVSGLAVILSGDRLVLIQRAGNSITGQETFAAVVPGVAILIGDGGGQLAADIVGCPFQCRNRDMVRMGKNHLVGILADVVDGDGIAVFPSSCHHNRFVLLKILKGEQSIGRQLIFRNRHTVHRYADQLVLRLDLVLNRSIGAAVIHLAAIISGNAGLDGNALVAIHADPLLIPLVSQCDGLHLCAGFIQRDAFRITAHIGIFCLCGVAGGNQIDRDIGILLTACNPNRIVVHTGDRVGDEVIRLYQNGFAVRVNQEILVFNHVFYRSGHVAVECQMHNRIIIHCRNDSRDLCAAFAQRAGGTLRLLHFGIGLNLTSNSILTVGILDGVRGGGCVQITGHESQFNRCIPVFLCCNAIFHKIVIRLNSIARGFGIMDHNILVAVAKFVAAQYALFQKRIIGIALRYAAGGEDSYIPPGNTGIHRPLLIELIGMSVGGILGRVTGVNRMVIKDMLDKQSIFPIFLPIEMQGDNRRGIQTGLDSFHFAAVDRGSIAFRFHKRDGIVLFAVIGISRRKIVGCNGIGSSNKAQIHHLQVFLLRFDTVHVNEVISLYAITAKLCPAALQNHIVAWHGKAAVADILIDTGFDRPSVKDKTIGCGIGCHIHNRVFLRQVIKTASRRGICRNIACILIGNSIGIIGFFIVVRYHIGSRHGGVYCSAAGLAILGNRYGTVGIDILFG